MLHLNIEKRELIQTITNRKKIFTVTIGDRLSVHISQETIP